MPGVYFVTTQEPFTGHKTQVTAVFPSRNQSVAVKAENDRKMAEMSVPQQNQNVRIVDQPYTVVAPRDCSWQHHPNHQHHPHHQHHQHHHYQNPFHYGPPLPPFGSLAMPPPMMMPSPMMLPPMSAPAVMPFGAQQPPWLPHILPPILQQQLPPATELQANKLTDEVVSVKRNPPNNDRKLRDILLVDDSAVRSLNARDSASRRRLAAHNNALRVILQSPLHDNGNLKSVLAYSDND